ncbi:hypothetical protein [Sphaerotilus sp.]|uniref:hypothetical protein n=1 Tax=Sphaerotilus sp. TaxID=2093942 RepID=UPI00286DF82D|nr:hypothetical protein [Sphaerotilus sp.]
MIPSKSSGSTIGGIWFVFSTHHPNVALWCSSFTGKQKLFLDGAIVAEGRNITGEATYPFTLESSRYVVKLSLENMSKGVYRCMLSGNGVPIESCESRYSLGSSPYRKKITIGMLSFLSAAIFSGRSELMMAAGLSILAWVAFVYWPQEGKGFTFSQTLHAQADEGRNHAS